MTANSNGMVDISKDNYSGAALTPLENAQLREMLVTYQRNRYLRGRAWFFLTFSVVVPTALMGMFSIFDRIVGWHK